MAVKQHDDLRAVGRVFAVWLDADLPDHLEVTESEDFLVLQCTHCSWQVVFSSGGPTAKEIAMFAAEEHLVCDAPALASARG